TAQVYEALQREFYYAFSGQRYPGVPQLHVHQITNHPFTVAGVIDVMPIEVMHFKLPVFGYRFGDFAYITDARTIPPRELDKLKGCRVLVLNALQKEKHISHLTLEEAIGIAKEVGAEQTYFT